MSAENGSDSGKLLAQPTLEKIAVEVSITPASALLNTVSHEDPLSLESHPYRPSIERAVAFLCVEPDCDCIYAKEVDGQDGEGCPRCGNRFGIAIRRFIRGHGE